MMHSAVIPWTLFSWCGCIEHVQPSLPSLFIFIAVLLTVFLCERWKNAFMGVSWRDFSQHLHNIMYLVFLPPVCIVGKCPVIGLYSVLYCFMFYVFSVGAFCLSFVCSHPVWPGSGFFIILKMAWSGSRIEMPVFIVAWKPATYLPWLISSVTESFLLSQRLELSRHPLFGAKHKMSAALYTIPQSLHETIRFAGVRPCPNTFSILQEVQNDFKTTGKKIPQIFL